VGSVGLSIGNGVIAPELADVGRRRRPRDRPNQPVITLRPTGESDSDSTNVLPETSPPINAHTGSAMPDRFGECAA